MSNSPNAGEIWRTKRVGSLVKIVCVAEAVGAMFGAKMVSFELLDDGIPSGEFKCERLESFLGYCTYWADEVYIK